MSKKSEISKVASLMGKRGYRAKLKKYGAEFIADHARKVGKKGGRPKRSGKARRKAGVK